MDVIRVGLGESNEGGEEGFVEGKDVGVGALTSTAPGAKAAGAWQPWEARKMERVREVKKRGPAEEPGSRRPMPLRRAGRVERWRAVEEREGLLVRWKRTRDMVELIDDG